MRKSTRLQSALLDALCFSRSDSCDERWSQVNGFTAPGKRGCNASARMRLQPQDGTLATSDEKVESDRDKGIGGLGRSTVPREPGTYILVHDPSGVVAAVARAGQE